MESQSRRKNKCKPILSLVKLHWHLNQDSFLTDKKLTSINNYIQDLNFQLDWLFTQSTAQGWKILWVVENLQLSFLHKNVKSEEMDTQYKPVSDSDSWKHQYKQCKRSFSTEFTWMGVLTFINIVHRMFFWHRLKICIYFSELFCNTVFKRI